MLTFNADDRAKICSGGRLRGFIRDWGETPRLHEGQEHTCHLENDTRKPPFAKVKIIRITRFTLGNLTETMAKRMGEPSVELARRHWEEKNPHGRSSGSAAELWFVEFDLLQLL